MKLYVANFSDKEGLTHCSVHAVSQLREPQGPHRSGGQTHIFGLVAHTSVGKWQPWGPTRILVLELVCGEMLTRSASRQSGAY